MSEPNYSPSEFQPVMPDLGFGILTGSVNELREYYRQHQDEIAQPDPIPSLLEAFCYVCQSRQLPEVQSHHGEVNWRETLRCPSCGLMNRWRSNVHVFEAFCRPRKSSAIYITEAVTPLYKVIKQRYRKTIGSEFVEGVAPGSLINVDQAKLRIEDVTRLSLKTHQLDAVLCFDVLEHVPDYRQALREFFRVLKPGGRLLWSAPSTFDAETEVRASIAADGSIVHHLPAQYHGDPFSDQGVLCFQSFGLDVLQEMEKIGFTQACVFGFADRHWGYMSGNVLFLACKPDTRSPFQRRIDTWLGH